MWRACAILIFCFAASIVGYAAADASPGLLFTKGSSSFPNFVGLCNGKEVISVEAFRDCEELRPRALADCATGAIDDEVAASQAEAYILWQRGEQKRLERRPWTSAVRAVLSPVQTRGVWRLMSPTEQIEARGGFRQGT